MKMQRVRKTFAISDLDDCKTIRDTSTNTLMKKPGVRKCFLRWKPPDSFNFKNLVVLILGVIFVFLPGTNGHQCQFNQVLQCNSTSNCSCIYCPVCPPGQGLSPQCGPPTVLTKNKTIQCMPCKRGTYSDTNGIGFCQSCQPCGGHKTLVKCNTTQDTVCSEECMDGFQWIDLLQMCRKVKVPKPDPGALHPTERPRITPHKTKSSRTPTSRTSIVDSRPVVKGGPKTNQSMTSTNQSITSRKELGTTPSSAYFPAQDNTVIILFSVMVGVCFLLLLLYCFKKKEKILRLLCNFYCTCRGISSTDQQINPEETNPMQPDQQGQELDEIVIVNSRPPDQQRECMVEQPLDKGSEDQQKEDSDKMVPMSHSRPGNLNGLLLRDITPNMKLGISVQISKKGLKGWKEIGTACQIPSLKLEEMETRSSYSDGNKLPGEYLLEFLACSQPDFTLKKFTMLLKSLEREDVLRDIQKESRGGAVVSASGFGVEGYGFDTARDTRK